MFIGRHGNANRKSDFFFFLPQTKVHHKTSAALHKNISTVIFLFTFSFYKYKTLNFDSHFVNLNPFKIQLKHFASNVEHILEGLTVLLLLLEINVNNYTVILNF